MPSDAVALDGSQPALRTCRRCGHGSGYRTGPKGPHADGIRCLACDMFLGWLKTPKQKKADQEEDLLIDETDAG